MCFRHRAARKGRKRSSQPLSDFSWPHIPAATFRRIGDRTWRQAPAASESVRSGEAQQEQAVAIQLREQFIVPGLANCCGRRYFSTLASSSREFCLAVLLVEALVASAICVVFIEQNFGPHMEQNFASL